MERSTEAARDFSMLVIDAPHFYAGVVFNGFEVVKAAPPILKYMKGWRFEKVEDYCQQKGWWVEFLPVG